MAIECLLGFVTRTCLFAYAAAYCLKASSPLYQPAGSCWIWCVWFLSGASLLAMKKGRSVTVSSQDFERRKNIYKNSLIFWKLRGKFLISLHAFCEFLLIVQSDCWHACCPCSERLLFFFPAPSAFSCRRYLQGNTRGYVNVFWRPKAVN